MTDETPKYAEGGIIPAGTFETNTTSYPETIISSCGYPWLRTEVEGDDEQRE